MSKLNFLGGRVQLFDDNGNPLAGGRVNFFEAGTSTRKDTYTDSTLSVPNPNPVLLDSAGRATIWLNGDYKVEVRNANQQVMYTDDSINPTQDIVQGNYNLIANPSFETPKPGNPSEPEGWNVTIFGADGGIDTQDASHGVNSFFFTCDTPAAGGGNINTEGFIPITSLRSLELTFAHKASTSGVHSRIEMWWYDRNFVNMPAEQIFDQAGGTTEFSLYRRTTVAPANAVYLVVFVWGSPPGVGDTGTVKYDNLVLQGDGFQNPMTTAGDMISATAGGVPARVPTGIKGDILLSSGTAAVPVFGALPFFVEGFLPSHTGVTDPLIDVAINAGIAADLTYTRTIYMDAAREKRITTDFVEGSTGGGQVIPVQQTGTFTTVGTAVTGIGTTFTTEFQVGDILRSSSLGQGRQVASITDNLNMVLISAFGSDITVAEAVFRGGVAPDAWFGVHALMKNDGSIDIGFDPRQDASALLPGATGFTFQRRVGWLHTNSSTQIEAMVWQFFGQALRGLWRDEASVTTDVNESFSNSVGPRELRRLKCPFGNNIVYMGMARSSSGSRAFLFTNPDQADMEADKDLGRVHVLGHSGPLAEVAYLQLYPKDSMIGIRVSNASGSLQVMPWGFEDPRA